MTDKALPDGVSSARGAWPDQLLKAGMSQNAAVLKAALFSEVTQVLYDASPKAFPLAVFVPGRIELLGKHTDYAGGLSMTVAAEQGFCMAATAREDASISVVDVSSSERIQFSLSSDVEPPLGSWANYPMTVARRLARNFPGIAYGADIAFASDLPRAAGMSSSSAFMVAVFMLLAEINRLSERAEYRNAIHGPSDLAAYLATIENGRSFGALAGDLGVGTLGGSEDQTAILCSESERISEYSYCPVTLERRLPMPPDCVFAVGVSGVVAEKTGAAREKYNNASRLASALLSIWQTATGRHQDLTLAAAVHSDSDAIGHLKRLLPTHCPPDVSVVALQTRLEHFLVENDFVIPAASEALAANDLAAFGRAVDRSQEAAEHLLGNQVPETSHLAAEARRQGALAASAFGAGFGGSVWAMVRRDQASQFMDIWAAKYRDAFPQHAETSRFFLTSAGPAACFLPRS
jgi:galactokinase